MGVKRSAEEAELVLVVLCRNEGNRVRVTVISTVVTYLSVVVDSFSDLSMSAGACPLREGLELPPKRSCVKCRSMTILTVPTVSSR